MTLFTLDNLKNDDIISIVKEACTFEFDSKNSSKANGFVIGILFFEPSTRTRYSFEVAAKRLGMETLSFTGGQCTSVAKGETLYDTVKTFENIGVDAMVIRHPQKEYYKELSDIKVPILSGGDGSGNHPTQCLVDLLTIYKEFGKFKGLKIAIMGDIKHSRVARTNIAVMRRLGMEVNIVCPSEMLIEGETPITIEEAIKTSDILMALRVQIERHKGKFNYSKTEYNLKYGLNSQNIKNKKPHSIIMHPGPVYWGFELEESIMKHKSSRINQQVENGIKVRAVLLKKIFECK